jgi:predicted ATP-grasp superfamily ATP-dependent carboligase
MRLFAYEYSCAAAPGCGPLAPSLRAEGRAMLTAVLHDLARVPGIEPWTLLGADLGPCPAAAHRLERPEDEPAAFRRLAEAADYTLVIAPEFDGLLAARCRWVLEAGGRLLGPSPAGVELTADKLVLARLLERRHVPTPPCYPLDAVPPPGRHVPLPVVLKPRDGAGSQATCLVRSWKEFPGCLERMRAEMPRADFVLQPFAPGRPASVAFLLAPGQELALPPAAQHLSDDGRFRYESGTVPLPPELAACAVRLGLRAVRAVPGLCGYVGVDLVLGDSADGSGDRVIEINPRLTTSYLGLRVLARENLAAALLRAVGGEPVGELTWHPGPVHFRAK